ncbi:unnamed protein product [Leptosia nina]|uniref:Peptidase S1 domain-containing protein n=1 Tax=Leptosia nina TaxID=320188 RepID=A0AAV1JF64_9NEOP
MKLSVTKLIIQLLILLIIAAIIFILSISVYSIRYWPDVYNYIHANITIKRIPTITELNITYYEDTTDVATTDYVLDTTIEFESTDYFSLDEVEEKRDKRRIDIEKDYIELPKSGVVDYFFEIETSTRIMTDLVNEDKLTTNMNDVEIIRDTSFKKDRMAMYNESCPLGTSDDVTTVLSWIAAIFVKNETNQYQYHCDGVLLSTHIIVTAAHCVNYTRAEDLIVVLGTTSLQNLKEDQRIVKAITEVIVHENFTEASNDIALLRTLDTIETSHLVSIACLSDEEEYSDAVTTGWAASGELMAIHFDKEKSQLCTGAQDICGVYGNDVTVCPSFGGVYAVKQGGWYIRGIRQGDQTNRAICINEPVHYTPLNLYREWINYYV